MVLHHELSPHPTVRAFEMLVSMYLFPWLQNLFCWLKCLVLQFLDFSCKVFIYYAVIAVEMFVAN